MMIMVVCELGRFFVLCGQLTRVLLTSQTHTHTNYTTIRTIATDLPYTHTHTIILGMRIQ